MERTNGSESRTRKSKKHEIRICTGGGCIASGALGLKKRFEKEIRRLSLVSRAKLVETGCMGPCGLGPVASVDGFLYENLQPEDVPAIVKRHLGGRKALKPAMQSRKAAQRAEAAGRGPDFLSTQTLEHVTSSTPKGY